MNNLIEGLDKLTTDLTTNAVMETTSRFVKGMPIERKKNANKSKSLSKHSDSGMFSHINRKKLNESIADRREASIRKQKSRKSTSKGASKNNKQSLSNNPFDSAKRFHRERSNHSLLSSKSRISGISHPVSKKSPSSKNASRRENRKAVGPNLNISSGKPNTNQQSSYSKVNKGQNGRLKSSGLISPRADSQDSSQIRMKFIRQQKLDLEASKSQQKKKSSLKNSGSNNMVRIKLDNSETERPKARSQGKIKGDELIDEIMHTKSRRKEAEIKIKEIEEKQVKPFYKSPQRVIPISKSNNTASTPTFNNVGRKEEPKKQREVSHQISNKFGKKQESRPQPPRRAENRSTSSKQDSLIFNPNKGKNQSSKSPLNKSNAQKSTGKKNNLNKSIKNEKPTPSKAPQTNRSKQETPQISKQRKQTPQTQSTANIVKENKEFMPYERPKPIPLSERRGYQSPSNTGSQTSIQVPEKRKMTNTSQNNQQASAPSSRYGQKKTQPTLKPVPKEPSPFQKKEITPNLKSSPTNKIKEEVSPPANRYGKRTQPQDKISPPQSQLYPQNNQYRYGRSNTQQNQTSTGIKNVSATPKNDTSIQNTLRQTPNSRNQNTSNTQAPSVVKSPSSRQIENKKQQINSPQQRNLKPSLAQQNKSDVKPIPNSPHQRYANPKQIKKQTEQKKLTPQSPPQTYGRQPAAKQPAKNNKSSTIQPTPQTPQNRYGRNTDTAKSPQQNLAPQNKPQENFSTNRYGRNTQTQKSPEISQPESQAQNRYGKRNQIKKESETKAQLQSQPQDKFARNIKSSERGSVQINQSQQISENRYGQRKPYQQIKSPETKPTQIQKPQWTNKNVVSPPSNQRTVVSPPASKPSQIAQNYSRQNSEKMDFNSPARPKKFEEPNKKPEMRSPQSKNANHQNRHQQKQAPQEPLKKQVIQIEEGKQIQFSALCNISAQQNFEVRFSDASMKRFKKLLPLAIFKILIAYTDEKMEEAFTAIKTANIEPIKRDEGRYISNAANMLASIMKSISNRKVEEGFRQISQPTRNKKSQQTALKGLSSIANSKLRSNFNVLKKYPTTLQLKGAVLGKKLLILQKLKNKSYLSSVFLRLYENETPAPQITVSSPKKTVISPTDSQAGSEPQSPKLKFTATKKTIQVLENDLAKFQKLYQEQTDDLHCKREELKQLNIEQRYQQQYHGKRKSELQQILQTSTPDEFNTGMLELDNYVEKIHTRLPILATVYIAVAKSAEPTINVSTILSPIVKKSPLNENIHKWLAVIKNAELKNAVDFYQANLTSREEKREELKKQQLIAHNFVRSYVREQYLWEWVHLCAIA